MWKKLQSEKGASITFALLLFLCCAILSSVILTAATAAVGRMSKTAEMDQKYYSIMSAAELFEDILCSDIITVERTLVKKDDNKKNEDGSVTTISSDIITDTTSITDKDVTETFTNETDLLMIPMVKDTLKANLAYRLVEMSAQESGYPITEEEKISVILDGSEGGVSVLAERTLLPDGRLRLILRNGKKTDEGKIVKADDSYTVQMIFEPDFKTNTDVKKQEGAKHDMNANATSYKFSVKSKTTTVTTLRWVLSSTKIL